MATLLTVSISVLFAGGAYMLMRRSFIKLVIGLVLLGHAANLLIFTVARPVAGKPPLIQPGEEALTGPYSDPLPGALILTAIVISFGIVSYTIVLIKRTYQDIGTDDLEELTSTDR
ncbi:MAG: Na+/H+ antiporter subunit C [Phycisphaerales bacterium]